MKKIILILMTMLSTLTFSKKLYVGTNAEFVPYEYLENGEIKGFDIELMEAIGKELGYEIIWQNMAFDGLLPALQMNKIDAVIAGMTPTEERKKSVNFSVPYMLVDSNEHFIIVNSSSNISDKSQIKGKKVGVQLGTIQEEFANQLGANTQLYNDVSSALMDLKSNKIEAVIVPDASGKNYLKNISGIKKDGIIIDNSPGAAIAMRKNDIELCNSINEALITINKNGKYLEILKKFFPEKVSQYNTMNIEKNQ